MSAHPRHGLLWSHLNDDERYQEIWSYWTARGIHVRDAEVTLARSGRDNGPKRPPYITLDNIAIGKLAGSRR